MDVERKWKNNSVMLGGSQEMSDEKKKKRFSDSGGLDKINDS